MNMISEQQYIHQLCCFWAKTLTKNKASTQRLTMLANDMIKNHNKPDPVAVGIITKRLSHIDTKRLWTYLKPDFDLPDTENISEAAAAMHCLSPDELDLLLLCDGLNYDINQIADMLGIKNVQESYMLAFNHLHSLIAFEDYTTAEQQREITISVIADMCNEIKTLVSAKLASCENSHSKSKSELKRNIITSIGIFAAIDIIAIATFLCIFAFSNSLTQPFAENTGDILLENSVDNSRQGLYYEPEYIPQGYLKSAHSISPTIARMVYTNEAGEQILFTQQVSKKKIASFSDVKDYTLDNIDGRKTAVCTDENRTTLYWYSDFYAYSLTGMVAKDEMIKTVQGIKFQSSDLPFKYSKKLAVENGDIIANSITAVDVERIKQFYENYSNGKTDSIRICDIKNDDIIIVTVKITNGNIYYTKDARRINYSEHVFEDGMMFDEMTLTDTREKKQSLILHLGDQQLTLITF